MQVKRGIHHPIGTGSILAPISRRRIFQRALVGSVANISDGAVIVLIANPCYLSLLAWNPFLEDKYVHAGDFLLRDKNGAIR